MLIGWIIKSKTPRSVCSDGCTEKSWHLIMKGTISHGNTYSLTNPISISIIGLMSPIMVSDWLIADNNVSPLTDDCHLLTCISITRNYFHWCHESKILHDSHSKTNPLDWTYLLNVSLQLELCKLLLLYCIVCGDW